jgi:hypothetical protein
MTADALLEEVASTTMSEGTPPPTPPRPTCTEVLRLESEAVE